MVARVDVAISVRTSERWVPGEKKMNRNKRVPAAYWPGIRIEENVQIGAVRRYPSSSRIPNVADIFDPRTLMRFGSFTGVLTANFASGKGSNREGA